MMIVLGDGDAVSFACCEANPAVDLAFWKDMVRHSRRIVKSTVPIACSSTKMKDMGYLDRLLGSFSDSTTEDTQWTSYEWSEAPAAMRPTSCHESNLVFLNQKTQQKLGLHTVVLQTARLHDDIYSVPMKYVQYRFPPRIFLLDGATRDWHFLSIPIRTPDHMIADCSAIDRCIYITLGIQKRTAANLVQSLFSVYGE